MSGIAREVAATPMSQVVGMFAMIYTAPRIAEKTDAIVVCPGLGESWRLVDAIQAWTSSQNARHLLIAGSNRNEKSWFLPTPANLSEAPYHLTRHQGVVVQPEALHTKEQADWIVERVHELGISSLSLFVSPYHLPRAYSTLLASFVHRGIRIPMIPVPVMVAPDTTIPDTGLSNWQSVAGEVDRIFEYQASGDVASFHALQDYLNWLWKHPLITA